MLALVFPEQGLGFLGPPGAPVERPQKLDEAQGQAAGRGAGVMFLGGLQAAGALVDEGGVKVVHGLVAAFLGERAERLQALVDALQGDQRPGPHQGPHEDVDSLGRRLLQAPLGGFEPPLLYIVDDQGEVGDGGVAIHRGDAARQGQAIGDAALDGRQQVHAVQKVAVAGVLLERRVEEIGRRRDVAPRLGMAPGQVIADQTLAAGAGAGLRDLRLLGHGHAVARSAGRRQQRDEEGGGAPARAKRVQGVPPSARV